MSGNYVFTCPGYASLLSVSDGCLHGPILKKRLLFEPDSFRGKVGLITRIAELDSLRGQVGLNGGRVGLRGRNIHQPLHAGYAEMRFASEYDWIVVKSKKNRRMVIRTMIHS